MSVPRLGGPGSVGCIERKESIRISGVSRCLGQGGFSRIVVGKAGIPFLEEGPECAIEHPRSGLQQQVRAALRPLHLRVGRLLQSQVMCARNRP